MPASPNTRESRKVLTDDHNAIPRENGELKVSSLTQKQNPQMAWQSLQNKLQQRSRTMPSCPQCHCATPPAELKLWGICAHCATYKWQD